MLDSASFWSPGMAQSLGTSRILSCEMIGGNCRETEGRPVEEDSSISLPIEGPALTANRLHGQHQNRSTLAHGQACDSRALISYSSRNSGGVKKVQYRDRAVAKLLFILVAICLPSAICSLSSTPRSRRAKPISCFRTPTSQ